jgi:hypothetical protein
MFNFVIQPGIIYAKRENAHDLRKHETTMNFKDLLFQRAAWQRTL